jgi:hypothetical protein
MGYVILGNCSQCFAPIYTFDTYVLEKFHISCHCLGAVMLAMGVPHISQLPMPFEDSYYEEE